MHGMISVTSSMAYGLYSLMVTRNSLVRGGGIMNTISCFLEERELFMVVKLNDRPLIVVVASTSFLDQKNQKRDFSL